MHVIDNTDSTVEHVELNSTQDARFYIISIAVFVALIIGVGVYLLANGKSSPLEPVSSRFVSQSNLSVVNPSVTNVAAKSSDSASDKQAGNVASSISSTSINLQNNLPAGNPDQPTTSPLQAASGVSNYNNL